MPTLLVHVKEIVTQVSDGFLFCTWERICVYDVLL